MTLIRPRAACTTSEMTRSCSSCERVGDSPVVPTGQRHCVPAATCISTCSRSSFTSTCPPRNGVTIATESPANAEPLRDIDKPARRIEITSNTVKQFAIIGMACSNRQPAEDLRGVPMRYCLPLLLATLPLLAWAQDKPAEFQPLFDGKSLKGWVVKGDAFKGSP